MKPTLSGGRRPGEVDRLSALPDEIIHEILARLRSPKEPAKASLLSRRWKNLWRSYPILEFDDSYDHPSSLNLKRLMEGFAAAAAEKFSSSPKIHVEAVRLHFKWDREDLDIFGFITDTLNLVANRASPVAEIDIGTPDYYCCTLLQAQLMNHHRHLRILNLQGCALGTESNSAAVELINLRVLCIRSCRIYEDQFLNGIIAGAPLLESLTLDHVDHIRTLQIRNHPSLKSIHLYFSPITELFQINGAHNSLENLTLDNSIDGDLDISPLAPNLKSLHIDSARNLTAGVFNDLISGCPSLESVFLGWTSKADEIKIVSPNLQRLTLGAYQLQGPEPLVLQIDAPKLVDAYYIFQITKVPAISYVTNLEAAEKCDVDLCTSGRGTVTNKEFAGLKHLVAISSGQFRLLNLCL